MNEENKENNLENNIIDIDLSNSTISDNQVYTINSDTNKDNNNFDNSNEEVINKMSDEVVSLETKNSLKPIIIVFILFILIIIVLPYIKDYIEKNNNKDEIQQVEKEN